MLRMLLAILVALVLPPFLVHRMSPAEYGAWVLILQLGTYVNLLDLGLQTAIGKFVSEYDAIGDRVASARILSSSFVILSVAALVGVIAILAMSWRVPLLLQQMPVELIPKVRWGLLAVGLSVSVALPFNTFIAAFTGLQKYAFPAVLAAVSKILSSAALVALLLIHGSLVQLALLIGASNLITALFQFLGWRKYAKDRVEFSFKYFDRRSAIQLAKYGSVLSIWTVAGLFISGFDTVIVGHYDYANTGFYAIASSATNFMLLVIGNLFGPLLPAVSSMQSGSNSTKIGDITIRVTRYCALLLCILGLPLLFGAYPILTAWVGHDYAAHSALFLEVLVVSNMVRQLGYPYAIIVVATGKQHLATISAVVEACINIALSIWLVQRIGALGVALGTLVGAFVSLGVHIAVSMHFTRATITIPRKCFLLKGLLRPLVCITPSVFLYPIWNRYTMLPAAPIWIAVWSLCTLAIIWTVGLTSEERRRCEGTLSRLLYWRYERT